MTPDEERLQRYLEWRRAGDRERAGRRRRAIGYVAVPALCVIAVGLASWLGRPSSERSASVNAVAPAIPRETTPSPSGPESITRERATSSAPPSSHTQVPERPTVELSKPPTRPRPHTAPPVASPPRARPAPSSRPAPDAPVAGPAARPDAVVGESDVAAAVAPAPAPAPVNPAPEARQATPSEERREAVSEAPREAPSEALPPPAPRDVVALPAPQPEDAVQNPPAQDPPPATTSSSSGGAVAVAPPTVRERVSGWAKGEVREFRDGVKREIRDFRSGYDKVRNFFRR
jgi:hypothetical protein